MLYSFKFRYNNFFAESTNNENVNIKMHVSQWIFGTCRTTFGFELQTIYAEQICVDPFLTVFFAYYLCRKRVEVCSYMCSYITLE